MRPVSACRGIQALCADLLPSPGTVTFGGINLAQIQGDILEIPNVSEIGFWEAALDDIQVNGVSLNLAGKTAILDTGKPKSHISSYKNNLNLWLRFTGTTLAIIPEADAIAIHSAIPGSSGPDESGAFTIPCTSPAVLSFVFNGRSFAIDPQDLPFVPLTTDLQGECQSAISTSRYVRLRAEADCISQWLEASAVTSNTWLEMSSSRASISQQTSTPIP